MKHSPLLVALALTLALLTPAARAQTPFGNAISFNGTNQYVAVTNFGSIIPTNEITVEFWANTSETTGQSAFILNPDDGNNRFNAHLNYGPPPAQGVTYWDFGNISGNGRLGDINAPVNSISNWVHYAFVASQSGNFMSVYTNGVLMATKSGMTPFIRGTYDLHIGGSSNYFSYHGTLDDFRVWNVARTQAQIQSDLGVTLAGSEPNLLLYYRFDSISGTVATNSATATGVAFNGTLVNGPTLVPSTVATASALNSVVTTNSDSGPGSLRLAIANAFAGSTITFATNLSGSTITLTNGELVLTRNCTIDGSMLSGGIVINGNGNNRVIYVQNGMTILNSLTITNGYAGFSDPYHSGYGGGIFNDGILIANNCTVVGNSAAFECGGIQNNATATLTQCTITGNASPVSGGGVRNEDSLTINQCTIVNNSGGGIYNVVGGGGFNATVNVDNSIVAGNSGDADVDNQHVLNFAGANIAQTFSGNATSGPTPINAAPDLAPLGNYGGPTPTMPPLAGSPAIDAAGTPAGLTTDQRGPGFPRVMNFYADIGSVEALVPSIPNASFEVDDYTNEPGYASGNGGIITGWVISDPTRIGLSLDGPNSPGPFANSVVPDGTNFAFIQSVGTTNSISTTISGLVPGSAYQVIFRANCRGGYTLPVATWSLNGGPFLPFTAGPSVDNSNPYYTNSGAFTATSNTAPLIVRNGITSGDSALLLDGFTVAPYHFIVTTANDGGAGSLRQVISQADASATITFAAELSGSTITLTNGQISLNTDVTIDGSALPNGIAINGNAGSRIFAVNGGATVVLNSLTVINGKTAESGGGILNSGALTVNDCTIVGNVAQTADGFGGGGIYNESGATLTVNNSTITGNQCPDEYSIGGGGILNYGTLTVNNSTIVGNSAAFALGGGGGIANEGTFNLTNTIVCNNTALLDDPPDIYPASSGIHNLVGGNPLLASLGNYGGPTPTMPPLAGSPAIDAGSDTVLSFLVTDQRGHPRLSGAHVDIGAVEADTNSIVTLLTDNGAAGSLRYVATNAQPQDLISFAPNLSGQVITLTNGQIVLTNNVTIDGSALPNGIQINGNHSSRIFAMAANSTATLTALTITNGSGSGSSPDYGGGIINFFADSTLTLNRCTVAGNFSPSQGGGLYNFGTTIVNECTFSGNAAGGNGGGGIYNDGIMTILQSTLSGNTSTTATTGDGVAAYFGTLAMTNTIVAGNSGPSGLDFTCASPFSGDSNLTNGNPLLEPLGSYGGPTPTMPPLAGSPCIDSGSDAANLFATDQRGHVRLAGAHVDIGAVEVDPNSIVTTNSDGGAGSLRFAVASVAPGDLISFAPNLTGRTILVTNGEIELSTNVTIDASSLANGVQVSGGKVSRIFDIAANASVTLSSLTLRDANGGGADGGAIRNAGATVLNNCTLTNNATGSGGAILNNLPGSLALNNCTLVGNSTAQAGGGGAIFNHSLLALNNCTLAGNTAGGAGAIYNAGTADITNSTFVGNSVQVAGGALTDFGVLALVNCVLSGNTAAGGPNLYESGSSLIVNSTLISDGTQSGVANGSNGNLVGTSANPINARLAPLGYYGGPTETMPPLPGSPAINAGASTSLATDQRGLPRVVGGQTDIGSVELQTPSLVVTTSGDDSNSGTLRNVVAVADVSSSITFAPGLAGQTIVLTNNQIPINTLLVIDGSTLANGVQISGNNSTRIFNVGTNGNLTLNSLTLENANGGGGDGGAILNVGAATLNACTLTGNSTGSGGAIVNNAPGVMALNNCTVTGNSSAPGGGGGAIVNRALLAINNCTFANNTSRSGSAIYNDFTGILDLTNSILTASTFSIYDNGTENAGFDLIDPANINLAALGNYGGPTQTMPPLSGSPAIDAGSDTVLSFLVTDQRGYPRRSGAHVDIGAVEVQIATQAPDLKYASVAGGALQFGFTNLVGGRFSVFASTNLALPLNEWSNLGTAVEAPPGSGNFQFTDPQASTNYPRRFYRVSSP